MNKTLCGLAFLAAITLVACGNPPATEETTTTSQEFTVPANAASQPQAASPSTIVDMNQPAQTTQQAVPVQQQSVVATPVQPQATAKASGALNPEHGKPGHRCDIAVGAPLSSPVASAQPQQIQQVNAQSQPQPQMQVGPQITPIQPAAGVATGKGRVNPAHGQPGHDCAKQVGAPLD